MIKAIYGLRNVSHLVEIIAVIYYINVIIES
jgi:hypothetical protein